MKRRAYVWNRRIFQQPGCLYPRAGKVAQDIGEYELCAEEKGA